MIRNRSLGVGSFLALAMLCSCAPSASGPELSSSQAALTTLQCSDAFDLNGKDTICHATGSAKNPFVEIQTSEAGCINGHSGHADDFIEPIGGTCNGQGCRSLNAPCNDTHPCCAVADPYTGLACLG